MQTVCSSGVNLSRTFNDFYVQTNKSISKTRLNRRTNRRTYLDDFYVQNVVHSVITLRRLVCSDDLSVSGVKTSIH